MASKKKRKWQKKLGKLAKAAPIVTGVGGAVIGHQFGAVAGGAFTTASAFGARYAAGAGARGAGKRHSAGKWGQQAMQRTLIGGGIGTVAGAGVAALQAYGNTGKANVAAGTFLGGKQNFLGISQFTQEGLDSALPSLQKSFGFTPRTLRKDIVKKAKDGDWNSSSFVGSLMDKGKGLLGKGGDNESEAPGGGGMGMFGGMMRQTNDDEPTSGGNAGLIAAGLLGLVLFMG